MSSKAVHSGSRDPQPESDRGGLAVKLQVSDAELGAVMSLTRPLRAEVMLTPNFARCGGSALSSGG